MIERIIAILIAIVFCASQSWAATYCLHNNGTAGSKTAATDCLTVGNCMNESVHNSETFAADDIILVCPHGGNFDYQVTTPSSGGSGTEIKYAGQYSSVYGWPVFSVGFSLAADYIMVYGIEFEPGASESGIKTFEGIRIADTSRSWQAAEETPITGWTKTDKFIVGAGIGMTGGGSGVTPEIRWRDKTDSGSWTALAASGELKYGDCTALTDEANLVVGSFGTSSGKTKVEGVKGEQENSAVAGGSTTLTADQYTEIQACFDSADSENGHEYALALFESGTQVGGESLATLTTETACELAGCAGTYKLCWTADYSGDDGKGCVNSGETQKDGTKIGLDISTSYGQSGTKGALLDYISDRIVFSRTGSNEINTDEGTMKCAIYINEALSTYNFVAGTFNSNSNRIVMVIEAARTVTGIHVGNSVVVRTTSNTVDSDCGSNKIVALDTWTNIYFAWSKASNQVAVKVGANDWCNDVDSDTVTSLTVAPVSAGFGDVGAGGITDYYYIDDCKISGTYKDASL